MLCITCPALWLVLAEGCTRAAWREALTVLAITCNLLAANLNLAAPQARVVLLRPAPPRHPGGFIAADGRAPPPAASTPTTRPRLPGSHRTAAAATPRARPPSATPIAADLRPRSPAGFGWFYRHAGTAPASRWLHRHQRPRPRLATPRQARWRPSPAPRITPHGSSNAPRPTTARHADHPGQPRPGAGPTHRRTANGFLAGRVVFIARAGGFLFDRACVHVTFHQPGRWCPSTAPRTDRPMRVIPNTTPAPEVRFASAHRTGGFDFSTHRGHVQANISATSPNPGDLEPLDQASVTTTPDEAEAIGHAWITWAQHARNECRRAPGHAEHGQPGRAN